MRNFPILLAFAILFVFSSISVQAQRKFEKLGRGVVAINKGSGNVFVSWRFLATDPDNIAFNLYRSIDGGAAVKVNSSPITSVTSYTDNAASTSGANSYYVTPVVNGIEGTASGSFSIPGSSTAKSYFTLTMLPRTGYEVNHVYVGDLDGDGEYDMVVKRVPDDSMANVFVEAYKRTGSTFTNLWSVDLGPNIEKGCATHNPFILVHDFDCDGKAEVLVRSGEGTIFADGTKIGDVNNDGVSDYRTWPMAGGLGYMLLGDNCPEFMSMLDGLTGSELARTDYLPRYAKSTWTERWGDNYGHRMNMNHVGVAYLDGIHPSLVASRGPGENMDVAAWDYSNKTFTKRWSWSAYGNTSIPSGYHWADFHNIRILDLDGDGKDEISWGVNAMDDNGTPLYYAKDDIGHGDRFVISDINPDHPGVECYAIQQSSSALAVYYDAATGERFKTWTAVPSYDVGRGDCADIDPRYKGLEMWSYAHSTVLDCKGDAIPSATSYPAPALSVWWDGDLQRENLFGVGSSGYSPVINKWNYATNTEARYFTMYNEGGQYTTTSPYGGRVPLYADFLGDWREEIVLENSDRTELRIFSSAVATTYRIYCLMQNPEYRLCINLKAYLPSTEVDYYLGEGMTKPPTPQILSSNTEWKGGLNNNTWDVNTTANWVNNTTSKTFAQGDTVLFDIYGSASSTVSISGAVQPSMIMVSTPVDYTFTGTGSISGSSTILKTGTGGLILSNTNDYLGQTTVDQGALYVNGTLLQSTVWINRDAILGGTGTITKAISMEKGAILSPAKTGVAGTLNFSSGLTISDGGVLDLDLSDDPTGLTSVNDKIAVTGNLTLSGAVTINANLLVDKLTAGNYTIITFTGSFTGNLASITISGITENKCTLYNSGNSIYLNVESSRDPATVVWSGTSSVWDLLTTKSWILKGTSGLFSANDTVVFNSSGKANPAVTLTGSLSVAKLNVDASDVDYTFAGSGSILGDCGITKSGGRKLTISTSNSFTGPVIINGGTLAVNTIAIGGSASSLGAATSSIQINGGRLLYNGSTQQTTDRGFVLTGTDTLEVSNSAASFVSTTAISGSGKLVKDGAGTLTYTVANTYTGGTIIKSGKISLGNTTANQLAFGTGGLTFDGGILTMYNETSTDYTSSWAICASSTATINASARATYTGTVTGAGTINLNINATTSAPRFWVKGTWTGFSGTLKVAPLASTGAFRLGTGSLSSVSVYLASGITASYLGSNGGTETSGTVYLGELSGAAGSYLLDDYWVVGAKNTSSTFAGIISGSSLTKTGTGALTLSGANTYTGTTTISGGSLILANTTGSGTGTGAVTVASGATLAGTGAVSGTVTISSGGILAPGASSTIGTLSAYSSVTLNSGSYLNIKVNRTSKTNDLLNVTGKLTIPSGAIVNLQLTSGAYAGGDVLKILTAGTYTLTPSAITLVPSTPGTNMVWDVSTLATDGCIRVIAYQTATIASIGTKACGDADFTPVISSTAPSGTSGAGTPILSSSNTSVATILNNTTVHIVGVGTCNITVNYPGSSGYYAASATTSLTLVTGSQSITFPTISSQTYGAGPVTLSASSSSGLAVSYTSSNTSVASVSGTLLLINGAGTTTITVSQSGNSNFYAASLTQQLTVVPQPQAISFTNPGNMAYGAASFTLSATGGSSGYPVIFSLGSGEAVALSGVNNSVVTVLKPGTVQIIASQAGSNNYVAASASVSFTVSKAPQSILNFASISSTYGDADITPGASSTSGLTVTYTSSNELVASVIDNKIHILKAGSCTITAHQSGNEFYQSATDQSVTLVVDRASQPKVQLSLPDAISYTTETINLSVSENAKGVLSLESLTPEVGQINGSSLNIVSAGQLLIKISQAATENYNELSFVKTITVNKATAVVSVSTVAGIYNTSSATFVVTTQPEGLAWEATYNGSLVLGTEAGDYALNVTISDRNYEGSAAATLTINKASAEIGMSSESLTYSGLAQQPVFTTIPQGLNLVVDYYTQTGVLVNPLNAGLYLANARIDDPNYEGERIEQFIIFKQQPSVTWYLPTEFVYGTSLEFNQASASANVAGSFTYAPSLETVLNAGVHQIGVTFTPENTNYATVSYTQELKVLKAELRASAPNITKVYGQSNPSLSITYQGFVNSDDENSLIPKPVLHCDATELSSIGTYLISISASSIDNYALTVENGQLSITPASLTLTLFDTTKVQGAANPTFRYAFSGFVNSDDSSVIEGSPVISTTASLRSPLGKYIISATIGSLSAQNYTFDKFENAVLTILASSETKVWSSTQADVWLYPNPVLSKLAISLADCSGDYRVLSSSGAIILTGEIIENPTYIDLSNVPAGIYLVHIQTNSRTFVKQIVKQ